VSVAVIDSGVDAEHADFERKNIESVEARPDNKRIVFERSTSG
jgi:hypothetical protein